MPFSLERLKLTRDDEILVENLFDRQIADQQYIFLKRHIDASVQLHIRSSIESCSLIFRYTALPPLPQYHTYTLATSRRSDGSGVVSRGAAWPAWHTRVHENVNSARRVLVVYELRR